MGIGAILQAITICFMSYYFTKFQWSVLLLSSHSAKHVVVDVYWFSTKLDGGAVVGVLEKKT